MRWYSFKRDCPGITNVKNERRKDSEKCRNDGNKNDFITYRSIIFYPLCAFFFSTCDMRFIRINKIEMIFAVRCRVGFIASGYL